MGEPESGYTLVQVERLLGFYEGTSRTGSRHVTILDLLSWVRDPGGATVWYSLALGADPKWAWMARRGPLPPDSSAACVLWDFERAVRQLKLLEQAVVALTVAGFSPSEIAAVIDPDGVIDDADALRRARTLDNRKKRIARLLYGRPKRDAQGRTVVDERGDVLYTGGVAAKLARYMNGD